MLCAQIGADWTLKGAKTAHFGQDEADAHEWKDEGWKTTKCRLDGLATLAIKAETDPAPRLED